MLERVRLGSASGKVFYAADYAGAQAMAINLLDGNRSAV
jgi:hypothetical protein